jgi:hypothetical protein
MEFTYTAPQPPPTETRKPPQPLDCGGEGGHHANKHINKVSFRDKVFGNQALRGREKVDLLTNKKQE